MAAFKDYYEILGVDRDASQEDVKRAFRKAAVRWHPDRNRDDPSAEERFKELNEAYTALSDPEKRRIYDAYGRTGQVPPEDAWGPAAGGARATVNGADFAGFSDFFQTLFGAGGFSAADFGAAGGFRTAADPFAGADPFGRATPRGAARPEEARAELKLDLLRAFAGGEVPITVAGRKVTVTVPAGVRDGAKLRLRGQAPGGGDLILVVRHVPHPDFALEGDDVRVVARVPDHVAALGGSVRVPTLAGPAEVSVPAGSSSGRTLRLRGQGWPRREGGRGDQRVELRVTVPEAPNERQQELYRELRRLAEAAGNEAETESA